MLTCIIEANNRGSSGWAGSAVGSQVEGLQGGCSGGNVRQGALIPRLQGVGEP